MESQQELFSLKGKNAVIIGGSGVLGLAMARGLGRAGAKLAVCYRNADIEAKLEPLRREGIQARGYRVDVTDEQSVLACRDEIVQDFENIHILMNVAGGNLHSAMTSEKANFFELPLGALKEAAWLNLFGGAIIPAQVFGKVMLNNAEGGSIINITSVNAFRPLLARPAYAAAKAAVDNFTRWLAVHIARECRKNIRVNAIAPGFFLNERMRAQIVDEKGHYTERGKAILAHTPMGRLGEPDELIGTAVWLASDASKFVTGTSIPVDGGFTAFAGV